MRGLALAVTIIATAALGPGAAPATAKTRQCGTVTVVLEPVHQSEGSAGDIRATRVSCKRARAVARACFRDALHGWDVQEVRPASSGR
jgi:hypothetical protein